MLSEAANWAQVLSVIPLFGGVGALLLKHNCHEHRCLRISRVRCADGHYRCKRHWRKSDSQG